MCHICLPILGPHVNTHTPEACPLRKAMNCSICGKGKHFTKDCKYAKVSKKPYIPSIKPEATNTYILPDKLGVYIDYLRARGQEFDITLEKNRHLVQEFLKKQGRVLVNPIEAPHTPICDCTRCIKN